MEEVATETTLFRRDGRFWIIAFDGRVCRLPDAKGLHYLAYLLRHPGVAVEVTDLVAAVEVPRPAPVDSGRDPRERARLSVTKSIRTALRMIEAAHPGLARHLEVTIRRGYLCIYTPDPRLPIHWES